MKKIYIIPSIHNLYMEDICELQTLSKGKTDDKTGNTTVITPTGSGDNGNIGNGDGTNAGAKSSWSLWDDEDW